MKKILGINMKQWCREHEAYVLCAEPSAELLELHRRKIKILQHERLVHLIVTVMVVAVELFVVDITLLHPNYGIWPAVVMLALAVLLGFYFYHYFFLENAVQRWYRIEEELEKAMLER